MEARLFIGLMGFLAAFACAFSMSYVLGSDLQRRRASIAAQDGEAGIAELVSWRVRNGFAFMEPAIRLLLRIPRVADFAGKLVELLAEKGMPASRESIASIIAVVTFSVAVIVGAVFRSALAGAAVAACLVVALAAISNNARDKRLEAARDDVPAALESMAACFGSGFTLMQTFEQVASDVEGPLAEVFSRSAHVLEMGGSASSALNELRNGPYASELSFVAVALDVQHQSGGAMRQVLEAANDTVKGELALRRALRVQTAQARLSARVVAIMPLILITAFSLASPGFLRPFFGSVQGYALLALALIMQLSGILLVRRALVVEGVS